MKISPKLKSLFFLFSAFVFVSLALPNSAFAQKRDNLTEAEDELIRDAQEIDARMEIFVKVIERRLSALTGNKAVDSKKAQKDSGKWGELRTGTRAELLYDIQKTLEEAINKIDDAAAHDQKNPLFGKAVRILNKGCEQLTPQFKAISTTEGRETVLLANSIEYCRQIMEAAANVPKEEPKDAKKKKN